MPIRPEHRWLYPIDWTELSALIRFRRAKGRCERCGRPHKRDVHHLGDGRWYDEDARIWRDDRGRRVRRPQPVTPHATLPFAISSDTPEPPPGTQPGTITRVVLASAHLDHDPGHNHPSNLAALCQRCHLAHDRAEHRRQRWTTLFRRRALGDLFLGRYR